MTARPLYACLRDNGLPLNAAAETDKQIYFERCAWKFVKIRGFYQKVVS